MNIALLADNWRACWSNFSKLVTDIPLNSGTMMTEIVREQRLISHLFGSPKFLRCDLAFQNWEFELESIWPSIYNRQNPSCRSSLCRLIWKVLFQDYSYVVFVDSHVSFSPHHQMEKGKVDKMVVELLVFGILFGVICQSSWWACHDTLAIVTGLCRRER